MPDTKTLPVEIEEQLQPLADAYRDRDQTVDDQQVTSDKIDELVRLADEMRTRHAELGRRLTEQNKGIDRRLIALDAMCQAEGIDRRPELPEPTPRHLAGFSRALVAAAYEEQPADVTQVDLAHMPCGDCKQEIALTDAGLIHTATGQLACGTPESSPATGGVTAAGAGEPSQNDVTVSCADCVSVGGFCDAHAGPAEVAVAK